MTCPLIYTFVAYKPHYRIPSYWILRAKAGAVVWKMVGGPVGTLLTAEENKKLSTFQGAFQSI